MSSNNVQFYDFNLSAGGSQWLPVEGAYYRIIASTGAVAIKEDVGTTVGPIYAGQGMKNRNFNGLTISDKSGAANKGTLIIAGSDFVDDRITGEVSTIDGGKARSLASAAFIGYVTAPQVAAQYAQAEIWNKSTTKNLIVPALSIATTAANTLFLTLETVQLANLFSAGKCKRTGGAAQGELRNASTAVQPLPVNALKGWVLPQGYVEYKSSEPFIVGPGQGLRLSSYVQNIDFGATFEWFEELV